jgi:HEAT repeat protein
MLESLQRCGSRLSVNALLELLPKWEDEGLKAAAIRAVGKLGFSEPQICVNLRVLLKSASVEVVKAAADALRELRDAGCVDELVAVLKGKNSAAHYAALQALREITGYDRLPLNCQRWIIWHDKEYPAVKAGREALLAQLQCERKEDVLKAIAVLSKETYMKRENAVEIVKLASGTDPEVRKAAFDAVARMKVKETVPELYKLVKHSHNESVVAGAHRVLSSFVEERPWKR